MILSTHQPYFCPYPGFFFKAMESDIFVLLDSVQFPRGTTWISRNRFKNDQGTLWLTIPVYKKGLGLQRIDRVRICYDGNWTGKHRESIRVAYGRSPYLEEHWPLMDRVFSGNYETLVELNLEVIGYVAHLLGVRAEILRLSELEIHTRGTALILEICRTLGADRYLTQASAAKYLDTSLFEKAGIVLESFQPPSPVYPQLWGDFIPNLSVLDLLFNCGPKSREILLRASKTRPLPPAGTGIGPA